MKKYFTSISLTLIVVFFFTFQLKAQIDSNFITGNWEGMTHLFTGQYYIAKISLKKDIGELYTGKITIRSRGSWTGANYQLSGKYSMGSLTMQVKDMRCKPLIFILSFKDKIATLEGSGCTYNFGGIKVSRDLAREELALRNQFKSEQLSEPWVNGNKDNKVIIAGDEACLSFAVAETAIIPPKSFFIFRSGSKLVSALNNGLTQKNTNDRYSISFSITTDKISSTTKVPYMILLVSGKDTSILKQSDVSLTQGSANNAIQENFVVKKITGLWISDETSAVYEFRENGTYEVSKFYQNKPIRIYGTWNHHIGKCDQKESLNLDNQIVTYSSGTQIFVHGLDHYIFVNNSQNVSDNHQISGYDYLPNGGSNDIHLLHVEDDYRNDSLTAYLDAWIENTTWQGGSDWRFNFKKEHKITLYNPIQQADLGTWFWTYSNDNAKDHIYLWCFMGRTYGTRKYEVDLSKSSLNAITIRDISLIDPNYFTIYRKENLDVPEDIVGLHAGEVLLGWYLPQILLNNSIFSERYAYLFREINSALYSARSNNDFYKRLTEFFNK